MTSLLLNVQNLSKHTAMKNEESHGVNSIEQNWINNQRAKPKDIDQVSIASSTHFTLVNGCGRENLKPDTSFCRHDRKVTILTVTMTLVFIIVIIAMIYLMERKNKKLL